MQHSFICGAAESPKSRWTITRIRLGIVIIANLFANKNLRNEKNYRYPVVADALWRIGKFKKYQAQSV
jgi:hypothetical protein